MKQIDLKSLIIGFLLATVVVGAVAASGQGFNERYQLHNMPSTLTDAKTIKVLNGSTSVSITGVIKIDSQTGRTWIQTVRNGKIDVWVEK